MVSPAHFPILTFTFVFTRARLSSRPTRHPSGFHYNWTIVSLLNENDHDDGGPRYTRCFDATRDAVAKVNPNTTVQGPEVACGDSFCRGDCKYTPTPTAHTRTKLSSGAAEAHDAL